MSSVKPLSRREALLRLGALGTGIALSQARPATAERHVARPNFVFILVDEQRYDALGCAGHPFLKTPHIDRLAAEGLRFSNAFCTTSLCSPSRASFLTGMYSRRHGVLNNHMPFPEQPTFATSLQGAGYKTAFIGKWHMGLSADPQPGFDRWVSFAGQGQFNDPVFNIDGERVPRKGYMTDLLNDEAMDWLRGVADDTPFCLYLSHKAIHGPFTPPDRHKDAYSDAAIPLPRSWTDSLEGKPSPFRKLAAKQMRFQGSDAPEKHARYMRKYFRCLNAVDDGVGRLTETLGNLGLADSTYIIYAGDNGHMFGEHRVDDKRWAYEECLRIPFIIKGPGVTRPGRVVEKTVLNIDLAPTLLDLAGIADHGDLKPDGHSIRPLLEGRSGPRRKAFFVEYYQDRSRLAVPHIQAVRTPDWKYIHYPELKDEDELYDLSKDPLELHNVIADPRHAKITRRMRSRLGKYLQSLGEPSEEVMMFYKKGLHASKEDMMLYKKKLRP
ncbi:MAG: sulfatase-like hydrolase/transferase [Nitrospiraceae bacterium]|nr:sulfatase-like hydrolase/transferase [Nitrospiraceae bacterium]